MELFYGIINRLTGTKTGRDTMKQKRVKRLYRDWVNNFLTVERFAEYYNLSIEDAEWVIEAGKIFSEIDINK